MPRASIITPVPVMGESSPPFVVQRILTTDFLLVSLILTKSGVGFCTTGVCTTIVVVLVTSGIGFLTTFLTGVVVEVCLTRTGVVVLIFCTVAGFSSVSVIVGPSVRIGKKNKNVLVTITNKVERNACIMLGL